MNKEQIEDIIKDLENRGYEVRFKTYEDNIVGFYCNEHAFTIDYNSAKPVVGVDVPEEVCNKYMDDKFAVKVNIKNEPPVYAWVYNYHNGYYCHNVYYTDNTLKTDCWEQNYL